MSEKTFWATALRIRAVCCGGPRRRIENEREAKLSSFCYFITKRHPRRKRRWKSPGSRLNWLFFSVKIPQAGSRGNYGALSCRAQKFNKAAYSPRPTFSFFFLGRRQSRFSSHPSRGVTVKSGGAFCSFLARWRLLKVWNKPELNRSDGCVLAFLISNTASRFLSCHKMPFDDDEKMHRSCNSVCVCEWNRDVCP